MRRISFSVKRPSNTDRARLAGSQRAVAQMKKQTPDKALVGPRLDRLRVGRCLQFHVGALKMARAGGSMTFLTRADVVIE